jgi:metal-responsive CopG/Arc/MetJ family transcriptional regulator
MSEWHYTKKYSVSMTEEQMKKIDYTAEKIGQSRSMFIRRATEHYTAYLIKKGVMKVI